MDSVHVVVNPASGQPDTILNTLNGVLHPAGVSWDVTVTQRSGDAARTATEAAERGVGAVAAYGGDGTVMEVAQGLLDSGVPLAILPGGTANVMSQELGISKKLEEAASLLVADDARIREVDLGRIGDQLFILRALAGFGAARQVIVDRPMKDKYGMLAYQIGFVEALKHAKPFRCTLTLDGETHEGDAATVNVYNSANIGVPGHSVVPAEVDDGMLDVLAIGDIRVMEAASVAAALARGDERSDHFVYHKAKQVRVDCDPSQPIVRDGEDAGTTPFEAEVVPGAARIIVPAEA